MLLAISDELRLTIQVIASILFIAAVLWWVWRLPGDAVVDSAAAVVLAFISVWLGVASVGFGVWLWLAANPDLAVVFSVFLWSAAITTGGFALWIYRHTPAERMSEPILMQRLQARIGVGLGLTAVALWYIFILTHRPPEIG